MKKFVKTLTCTLIMAMLLSLNALAAPVVNLTEGETVEYELAATEDKFDMVAYYDDAIVAGGQYMIFVVAEEDGTYLPTASSILYINQAEAEDDGVVIFENVFPKEMQNSGIMISGTGISAPLLVAEIVADPVKKGDVNADTVITAADAQEIKRFAAGLDSLIDDSDMEKWLKVADINGDELLTAADAQEIERYAASLDSALDE